MIGERVLWLQVLLIGLQDCARGNEIGWIWSKDLVLVCHLAEVSPDQVRFAFQINKARLAKMGRI